jgi:hypothetical protein
MAETTYVQGLQRARFWTKVDRNGPNGCWLWLGAPNGSGYGQFFVRRKHLTAHRVAFLLARKVHEIPDDLVLDHLCRNKLCVNPDHLEMVTERENIVARGIGPTAKNAAKTHCPMGHEYTSENTRLRRGKRECRECVRAQQREQWKRGTRRRGN